MGTLHGAPLPEDFKDNTVLTADDFNAVKNYWVTNELPEHDPDDPDSVPIQNGDVVFVIGNDPVGDSGELPGLGGWATIEEVSGNPTRYEYPADNPEWVAFEWTDTSQTHTLTTQAGGLVDVLVVGGGGSGATSASPYYSGGGAIANRGLADVETTTTIKIGAGGASSGGGTSAGGKHGAYSSFGKICASEGSPAGTSASGRNTMYLGSAGNGAGATGHADSSNPGPGLIDSITGNPVEYGRGGKHGIAKVGPGNGGGGQGAPTASQPGNDGVVIVRVPAANDNTGGTGSTPASVVAAVDQAKETVKETIKRNRSKR